MWASEKVKRWEVCRPSWEVACDSRSCPAEMLRAANTNSKQLAIRYRTPLITRSWRDSCCDLIRVDSKGYRTATTKVPSSRLFASAAVDFKVRDFLMPSPRSSLGKGKESPLDDMLWVITDRTEAWSPAS